MKCMFFHKNIKQLKSLHTESEILIQNYRTLKNKYDLVLITFTEIFVRHKRFSAFSHPYQAFR